MSLQGRLWLWAQGLWEPMEGEAVLRHHHSTNYLLMVVEAGGRLAFPLTKLLVVSHSKIVAFVCYNFSKT